MSNIEELTTILAKKNEKEIYNFFSEIFTESELTTLSKRWEILKMLSKGNTQRNIANTLKVSLCKVTRGSKILKNKNSVTYNYFNNKGKEHD